MKMKKYLIALPLILAANTVHALHHETMEEGLKISGSAEAYTNMKTNQSATDSMNLEEGLSGTAGAEIKVNFSGIHASDFGHIIWEAKQKVDTSGSGTHHGIGNDGAYAGLMGTYGKLTTGYESGLIYNAADSLSIAGTWSMYSDVGGHASKYRNSFTYTTPSLGGFTLATQYNINTNDAYAVDVLGTYQNDMMMVQGGVHYGVNNAAYSHISDNFKNPIAEDTEGNVTPIDVDNSSMVAFFGSKFNLGEKVSLIASGKYNTMTNDLAVEEVDTGMDFYQFLLGTSFQMTEKDSIDGAVVYHGGDEGFGAMSANLQYNRAISESASFYLQAKHVMAFDDVHKYAGIEGMHGEVVAEGETPAVEAADNVTRIGAGVFVSF